MVSENCENCFRVRDKDVEGGCNYGIDLHEVMSDAISKRVKFNATAVVTYLICEQCKNVLCCPHPNEYAAFTNTWPTYVWCLLTDVSIRKEYGNYVWRLIPVEWHQWWVAPLKNMFPQVYGDITLEAPRSHF